MSTGISPSISASVTDHVTTCPDGAVTVTATVPRGAALKLDGEALKSGRSVTTVKLAEGQRFTLKFGSGRSALLHSVRCLPADFPKFTVRGTLPFVAPFLAASVPTLVGKPSPYAFVLDAHGVPIWWKGVPGDSVLDVKPVSGGRIGFWHGRLVGQGTDAPFSVYKLDGSLDRAINVQDGGGDAHDSIETPRGTWYRIASRVRDHVNTTSISGPLDQPVLDNVIQEINSDGQVIWEWSALDHIALSESSDWAWILLAINPVGQALDLIHMNSLNEDSQGNLVVSCRHLNAVFHINKADGSVDWKLGGTQTAKSLAVIGDDSNPVHLMGQHDANVLPDGSISVYDNGAGPTQRASRALRWRVNTAVRTAKLMERVTDPGVGTTPGTGSARKLSDGSWLMSWAGSSLIRSYTPAGKLRFDLKFAGRGLTYRAAPIKTSQISHAQFVAGMDAQFPR